MPIKEPPQGKARYLGMRLRISQNRLEIGIDSTERQNVLDVMGEYLLKKSRVSAFQKRKVPPRNKSSWKIASPFHLENATFYSPE